jgi:hypothetical protein
MLFTSLLLVNEMVKIQIAQIREFTPSQLASLSSSLIVASDLGDAWRKRRPHSSGKFLKEFQTPLPDILTRAVMTHGSDG